MERPVRVLDTTVAERIDSEREYHRSYYQRTEVPLEVTFDLATEVLRRPHNLTWAYYDTIRDHFQGELRNKRILVVGCGEGITALNLAKDGARVDAFDLSHEAIEICQRRAEFNRVEDVHFFVSSCEGLDLPAEQYDAVVGEMILHHIDIPTSIEHFHRLLKPGGLGAFMEWKMYPVMDTVRSIPLLKRWFPPGGVQQYATEFERKLSPEDFAIIRQRFPNVQLDYRYCLRGKIDYFSPWLGDRVERTDYRLLQAAPLLKQFTDGVIIRFTKE